MAPRPSRPFRFDKTTRADLWLCFHNEVLIADLENGVGDYLERRSFTGAATARRQWRQRDLKQLKRIKTAAAALLRAIKAARPLVQINLGLLTRELEATIPACAGKRGHPTDEARFQLECRIGWVLHRHGIALTKARGGKLARALQLVLMAVADARLEDPMRSICRVRDQVIAEAASIASLDRWVASSSNSPQNPPQ